MHLLLSFYDILLDGNFLECNYTFMWVFCCYRVKKIKNKAHFHNYLDSSRYIHYLKSSIVRSVRAVDATRPAMARHSLGPSSFLLCAVIPWTTCLKPISLKCISISPSEGGIGGIVRLLLRLQQWILGLINQQKVYIFSWNYSI